MQYMVLQYVTYVQQFPNYYNYTLLLLPRGSTRLSIDLDLTL